MEARGVIASQTLHRNCICAIEILILSAAYGINVKVMYLCVFKCMTDIVLRNTNPIITDI